MSLNKSELKEMLRQIVREEMPRADAYAKPTENHVDHVLACPDCFVDTIKKLREKSDVECEDCKLPMGSAEFAKKISACPFCGGRNARKITR